MTEMQPSTPVAKMDKAPEVTPPSETPEWWPTHFPRLWPLLNSSIGLWFLSSVVLGGLGALYAQEQKSRDEALKKFEFAQEKDAKEKTLVEKLDLEIGYRLSTAISQLADLDSNVKRCASASKFPTHCQTAQRNLDELFTSRATQPTLFPEFSLHSTLALVAELKRLTPKGEQESLEQVIYDMSGFYTMLDVAKAPLDKPTLIAGAMLKKLVLPRWRQGFYYLDCSKEMPFC